MRHEKLVKSLILKDFKTFYEEVVMLKASALSGEFLIKSEDDKEGESLAKKIHDRLYNLLDSQYQYIEKNGGGYAARYYREAQYIMVALADEIFINLKWVGQDEWENNLLESKIFNSQVAGEKFFKNLDQFLTVRDSANADIGVMYMLAIGLGFKGRYRDLDDKGALKKCRDQLFSRLMQDSPAVLEGVSELFPQAYQHTIDQRDSAKMPVTRNWVIGFFGVIVVFLVLSQIVWVTETNDMENLVDQVNYWVQKQ
jgi:type VI secretion system protein ImpK